jgi:hypothetical protein
MNAPPGSQEVCSGALEVYVYEAMEAHPGAMEAHSEAMEVHPEAIEAHFGVFRTTKSVHAG